MREHEGGHIGLPLPFEFNTVNLSNLSPRWYYGWNIIAIALLFQSLCIGMSYYCFPLWVVPLSDEFNVARSQIVFAIAASQVVSGLLAPFGGRALDRFPPHRMIAGGASVFTLGLIVMAHSHALWPIIAVMLILLPIGLVFTGLLAAQTLATRWFAKDRGFAIACASLGTAFGGFTMPPIAAALMNTFGWRTTLEIFGITILALTVLSWRILGKQPPQDSRDMGTETEAAVLPREWRTQDLLRNSNFQTIILVFVPLIFAVSAVQMNIGAYSQDIGLTQQDAAFLVAELSLFSLLGRIAFGKLVDKYDHRLLYRLITGGVMFSLAVVIAAFFSGDASGNVLRLGIGLLGITSSGYVPLNSIVIAAKFGTRAFGQVTGLSGTFLGLGTAGSFLAASIRDTSGSYPLAFLVFLLLLVPGLWLIRRIR